MDLVNKNYHIKFNNILQDDDNVTFEGLASTFGNVDLVGDEIAPGAFAKSLRTRQPKMLLQHDSRALIGRFPVVKEVPEGLFVKGELIRGVPEADKAGLLLKAGVLDAMSIGFNVIDSEKKEDSVLLKQIDLFEISLVTFPANPEAMVRDVKAVSPFADLPILKKPNGDPDTDRPWDSSAAIKRIRVKTGSEDSPSTSYKESFLYVANDGENFTDYSFPIADVVGDKIVVIPRAVFAAAAALSGARGGTSLTGSAKAQVIANVNKYYSKMGLDSPFNKSGAFVIDINRAKLIKSKREFEEILSDSVHLTKNARVYLASLISFESESQQEKQDKYGDQISKQAFELKQMLDSFINK